MSESNPTTVTLTAEQTKEVLHALRRQEGNVGEVAELSHDEAESARATERYLVILAAIKAIEVARDRA